MLVEIDILRSFEKFKIQEKVLPWKRVWKLTDQIFFFLTKANFGVYISNSVHHLSFLVSSLSQKNVSKHVLTTKSRNIQHCKKIPYFFFSSSCMVHLNIPYNNSFSCFSCKFAVFLGNLTFFISKYYKIQIFYT